LPTITILFLLTLALTLTLKFFVAPRYGRDVEGRFLERLQYIPSQTQALSSATLGRWLVDPANALAIRGYVFPVLFPLDIVFLVCLGLTLGLASDTLANKLGFLSNVPIWVWWVLPACYMAADLFEDSVIAAIFKSLIALTQGSFRLLTTLTAIKLATAKAAIAQVAFLGALYALLLLFPASKPI
jgi:hypothetical protein